jgi:hypothetical protein
MSYLRSMEEYLSYLEIIAPWTDPSVEGYRVVWQVYDFAKAGMPIPRIGETVVVAERTYVVTAVVHNHTNVKPPFLTVRVVVIPAEQTPVA